MNGIKTGSTLPLDESALKFRPGTDKRIIEAALRVFRAVRDHERVTVSAVAPFGARIVEAPEWGGWDIPRKVRDAGGPGATPVLEFIAASEGVKRDGSILRIDGVDTANLAENAVFLWCHNRSEDRPPIGRIVGLQKADDMQLGRVLKIRVARLATQTDHPHVRFANLVMDMYENGDLHAVSFSWVPVEAAPLFDAEGYWTGYDYTKSDALETSAVPVPADPDALMQMFRDDKIPADARAFFTRAPEPAVLVLRDVEPNALLAAAADLRRLVEEASAERAAVAFKKTPTDKDTAWDASAATARVAKWASSDGSGDKDKVDWSKYRQAFAWYDAENPEAFGSYKYPHHDIVDGKLTVLFKGVAAAAGRINAGNLGADEDKVKAHLAKEYALFDEKAPWDRAATGAVERADACACCNGTCNATGTCDASCCTDGCLTDCTCLAAGRETPAAPPAAPLEEDRDPENAVMADLRTALRASVEALETATDETREAAAKALRDEALRLSREHPSDVVLTALREERAAMRALLAAIAEQLWPGDETPPSEVATRETDDDDPNASPTDQMLEAVDDIKEALDDLEKAIQAQLDEEDAEGERAARAMARVRAIVTREGKALSKANRKVVQDAHDACEKARAACDESMGHLRGLLDATADKPKDASDGDGDEGRVLADVTARLTARLTQIGDTLRAVGATQPSTKRLYDDLFRRTRDLERAARDIGA